MNAASGYDLSECQLQPSHVRLRARGLLPLT